MAATVALDNKFAANRAKQPCTRHALQLCATTAPQVSAMAATAALDKELVSAQQPIPASAMAATAALDKELAAAREPIPVRRADDFVSKGLTNAVDRTALKGKPTSAFTTSGGGQEGWDLPGLSLAGIQTWLKLRTRVLMKPRLTADLGLDLNPRSRAIKPVAALTYQLRRKDVDWAALRVTHQRAVLVKSWDVHLDRAKLPVSFTLNTAAGLTWQGRPDFDINVGDLKPNWLVGVAAVTLLALRQPLTGVKTFGDTAITNPITAFAKGEVNARAQRKGDGLELGCSQLNAVLRF